MCSEYIEKLSFLLFLSGFFFSRIPFHFFHLAIFARTADMLPNFFRKMLKKETIYYGIADTYNPLKLKCVRECV